MTGPAIDLPAVRAARAQLAAIVAAHPELTHPSAHARLTANLSEIATMSRRLDPNATGASTTVGVRLSPQLLKAVEAERDRLAGLVPGSTIGLSDAVRSLILRAIATPSTIAPAAPVAPAPVRPVVVVAPAPDTRQLELAPVVALHNAANGASVATITSNDNATAKPKSVRPVASAQSAGDHDALKARHLAAIAAGHSERVIAGAAGLSNSTLTRWRNGKRKLTNDVAAKVDAALSKLGF